MRPSSFKPDEKGISELLSTLRDMKSVRFIPGSKASAETAELKIELTSGDQQVSVAFATGVKKKGIVGGSSLHDENFVVSRRDFDILEAGISDLENRPLPGDGTLSGNAGIQ